MKRATSENAGWCSCYDLADPSHVYAHPVGDLIDHDLNPDGECVCGPTPKLIEDGDGDDAWMYVHHSLDGRENRE